MPNYLSTGGHAMATTCPHCGVVGEHKSIRTAPGAFRYSLAATGELLLRLGMDLSFRRRTRECRECYREFNTAELDESYLFRLIDTLMKDRKTIWSLQDEIRALKAENTKLMEKQDDVAARAMNTLAELRDPSIGRRAIGLVPITAARKHAAGPSSVPLQ